MGREHEQIIVVTDLDATLLDHHSYSWQAARPALELLRRQDIPLVLNSSKTRAELLPLRSELDNHDPFVVENGGALYIPVSKGGKQSLSVQCFGLKRDAILLGLRQVLEQQSFACRAFSQMDTAELMELTGLPREQATLALTREYTEPLLWLDSDEALQRFTALLQPFGIRTVRGGRFVHLGGDANKGSCLEPLRSYYENLPGIRTVVIALGDSDNDLPMLAAADYPVLVRSPVKDFPAFEHPALLRTEACGPEGWNTAVTTLLEKLTAEPLFQDQRNV